MNMQDFVDTLVKYGTDFETVLQRLENVETVIAPLLGSLGPEILAGTEAAAAVDQAAVGAAQAVVKVLPAPAPAPAPAAKPAPVAAPSAADKIAAFAQKFLAPGKGG